MGNLVTYMAISIILMVLILTILYYIKSTMQQPPTYIFRVIILFL